MNKFEFLKDDLYLHYPIKHCVKMNTDELNTSRKKLIDWINNIDNANLLNFLNTLRIAEKSKKVDWWNNLTQTEIKDINQGLEDIANGDTFSSEEFWNIIKS